MRRQRRLAARVHAGAEAVEIDLGVHVANVEAWMLRREHEARTGDAIDGVNAGTRREDVGAIHLSPEYACGVSVCMGLRPGEVLRGLFATRPGARQLALIPQNLPHLLAVFRKPSVTAREFS